MSRGKRIRLEEGIYADNFGFAAVVQVGDTPREKRWLDDNREAMRQWRADTRAELLTERDSSQRQRADRRDLKRSIVGYLKKRKGRPGYAADRSHLKAWLKELGDKRRHQVTPDDVDRAIAIWRAGKKKKSETTIRHRVRVLREMYQALDGANIKHPLRDVKLPKPEEPAPIPVAGALIRDVAASLKAGLRHAKGYGDDPILSRARFLVYATTGQRPAQIGRAIPGDVDLVRGVWFVRPAKGGKPIPFPLNSEAREAWRVFIAAKAWGKFDPTGLAKVLRRHGWPKGIRPYNLRHTFAIDHLLAGTSLGDLQGLLGHASIQTTRRFYAPIQMALMTAAVDRRTIGLPGNEVPGQLETAREKRSKTETRRAARGTQKKASPKRKRL